MEKARPGPPAWRLDGRWVGSTGVGGVDAQKTRGTATHGALTACSGLRAAVSRFYRRPRGFGHGVRGPRPG